MEFLTTWNKFQNSYFLTALAISILIAPSLWVFVDSSTPGFWKWKYLGGFLYSIGWNIALISAGLIFRYVSKLIRTTGCYLSSIRDKHADLEGLEINSRIKTFEILGLFFETLSYSSIGISTFYFLFNILPMDSKTILPVYYSVLILGSLISVFIFVLLSKLAKKTENTLKKHISSLISLVSDIKVNHYFVLAKNVDHSKMSKEDVLSDTAEVDAKIFKTLKKI